MSPTSTLSCLRHSRQDRYEAVIKGRPERLVSGSDDFTMFMWDPRQPVPTLLLLVPACQEFGYNPRMLILCDRTCSQHCEEATASHDRTCAGQTMHPTCSVRGLFAALLSIESP